jgi:hypothetical protein
MDRGTSHQFQSDILPFTSSKSMLSQTPTLQGVLLMSLLSNVVSFVIFCNMLLLQQSALWKSEVIIDSPLIFVEEIRLPPCYATSCYSNGTFVIWPHELEITSTSPRGVHPRPVRKVSCHFEYLENHSHGLDGTWQPVSGDLIVHL